MPKPQLTYHHPMTRTPPSWACAWGEDEWGVFASFRVGTVEQKMRWIPAGTFWMGSPEGEAGRYDDEIRHLVTLAEGFWLADTPCTQELWFEVMGENPSRFASEKRPVEQVSWDACQAFFETLLDRNPELALRLPTEAEWEHACRAGRESATWLGDLNILGANSAPILDKIARYGGNSGVDFDLENSNGTQLVASKSPNPWGLYDMLGNVHEWCQDWFGEYSAVPVEDPAGPEQGSYRISRGGSWLSHARYLRAAFRRYDRPGLRLSIVGFRLARGPGNPGARSA